MDIHNFLDSYIQDPAENTYVDSITSKMIMGQTIYESNDYSNINEDMKQIKNQYTPRYEKDKGVSKKRKKLIDRFFSNMSKFSLDYDEDVVGKMRAVPADPSLQTPTHKLMNQDIFNSMSSQWRVKTNQEKNFYEKDLPVKREMLRKLALQPELEDILDTMANECIVFESDNSTFADPWVDEKPISHLKDSVKESIKESVSRSFDLFYRMMDWKNKAWDDFKRFLIEGSMAWEIIYDNLENPKKIVGIVPIDAATLTKVFDNGKVYWVQFKGVTGREKKLLDAQVIYIQYQENVVSRQSYLERLIRPYNIYRIIEQAQIIWTITNASYKTKFTIPVNGMPKNKAMQTISVAMNKYKEDIKFSPDTGELSINGVPNLPFNKEYWLPETDSGSPEIENIGGDGPELADNDQLRFFRNELYKISKIPPSRFDRENQESFFGTDTTSMARDEIAFGRFVTKLRNTFSKIILKPIQLQLALDIPEVQESRAVMDAVNIRYVSYNLFEELFEMEVVLKRAEFIQQMKEALIDMDAEGNEVKFFSSKWLVEKYLKLSDDDVKLNIKYKKQEVEDLKAIESNGAE